MFFHLHRLQSCISVTSSIYPWFTFSFSTLCKHIGKYFLFKYLLGKKCYVPDQGSNSWPPDHDSTFHVPETPAVTTQPSVTLSTLPVQEHCHRTCPQNLKLVHCMRPVHLTLRLPGPSAGLSGSLDSYCSLKPLCSGMGEVVPACTLPTLLPPSPRNVLSLSCFKVLQCINCRD